MANPLTSYKSIALANQLADWLKARLGTSTSVLQGFDTGDGAFTNPPIIYVCPAADTTVKADGTNATAGHANFQIKVCPVPWATAQDVLGNPAIEYTPHVIRLITEADPTGGAGSDPTTRAQLLAVTAQLTQMGTRVEWYETANGTAPTIAADPNEATPGTATLRTTWDPDFYRPLISAQ